MGEKQINAMIINEKDHVIMTTENVKKGQTLCYRDTGGCHTLTALEDIPKYHKAAVKAVKRGKQVLKYGENIGRAGGYRTGGMGPYTQSERLSGGGMI